ncbi:hypothetical protein ABT392_06975 [Paucibacter sp. JuS9]|uniref:hypothetical protein n=1 Tax=Paucibacter sp. JuS9 TaxID=3228748 RepID=UPI0037570164
MDGKNQDQNDQSESAALTCGIVMPISAIDGCSAEHWAEVKILIQDAVEGIAEPKFQARLVSEADEVGVIHKRIVRGVYSSEIVVCDVSCKNANVMFELGLRLAFDKPTVIIKDDKTDYPFDTGVIEHLTYPRDLRYPRMVEFKQLLARKVLATYKAGAEDPNFSMFLKHFGEFKLASLQTGETTLDQAMIEGIGDLQREVAALRRTVQANQSLLSGGLANLGLGSPVVASSPGLLSAGIASQTAMSPDDEQLVVGWAESRLTTGSLTAFNELMSIRGKLASIAENSKVPETRARASRVLATMPSVSGRSKKNPP